MIIFLYTDKNCEYQAIACIKSLLPRIGKSDKILYYTIGFDSSFESPCLQKVRIAYKKYPTFHYYKSELSLMTMDLFPNEENFMFTDTDVLFSKRFNPSKLVHTHSYPLASYGPHEFPYTYEVINGKEVVYNELALMEYYGVTHRCKRYVWSCIFVYNKQCRDFLEEYTSICKNEYLHAKRKWYYPFHDETAFNVCLFKRKAEANLGFAFVNTHNPEIVRIVESNVIKDKRMGLNIDEMGNDWEYINDSEQVIMYHGFKNKEQIDTALKYLIP
jgi:hypothetical protein